MQDSKNCQENWKLGFLKQVGIKQRQIENIRGGYFVELVWLGSSYQFYCFYYCEILLLLIFMVEIIGCYCRGIVVFCNQYYI